MNRLKGEKPETPYEKRRALTLDTQKYLAMMESAEMTEEQKSQVIEALWTFVITFMDLDYEVRFLGCCGKGESRSITTAVTERDMLSSKLSSYSQQFYAVAAAKSKEAS